MSFIVSKFHKGRCYQSYSVLVIVSSTFDIWNTISYTTQCRNTLFFANFIDILGPPGRLGY